MHTPTPYSIQAVTGVAPGDDRVYIVARESVRLADIFPTVNQAANAKFIVTACNGYDALVAERDALRAALQELVRAADPHSNMSDLPVWDALAKARAALQAE